jgi:hypothetical protein
MDDSESTLGAVEGRPGWKVVGNWEVQEKETTNWEIGPDGFDGKHEGHILSRTPLPRVCRVEFEARITANEGSDEIDVIVGDVMMLYYGAGVRLDWMTEEVHNRERNKKMVGRPAPEVNRWYRYSLDVTDKGKCTASIDGEKVVEFDYNFRRTWSTGRFGFAHWRNTIQVRKLKIEALKTAG